MCILTAKYFKGLGFVAVKNRDRNYTPVINFRKSNRNGMERLYIWDENTRYTEGLNEHGVAILSASLMTKDDEKEHTKGEDTRDYYSPDGKKIRDALLCTSVREAVRKLIDDCLSGHTLIFDQDHCYVLEGAKLRDNGYAYQVQKVNPNNTVTRTNHGVLMPRAGYQRGVDEAQTCSRISSESRLKIAECMTDLASSPMDLLDRLTYHECENPQLNACRLDTRPSQLKTTGQLMIVPSKKTLYYRPIMCEINFDYWRVNHPDSKTYFELCGMRPLLQD